MSSKTKIVVLRLKELIYTGIFVVLGILFIVLLIIMFLPDKEKNDTAPETASLYTPGVYTTSLVLGSKSIDVEVIVDADTIHSIRLVNLDEVVTTMYPLIEPSFESLVDQIYEQQSLEQITYADETKYTSMVLLNAIQASLEKAEIEQVGE